MSVFFFFSSRRRHTRLTCDWSSDVCSSDLVALDGVLRHDALGRAGRFGGGPRVTARAIARQRRVTRLGLRVVADLEVDRKSTRLNSSHMSISYAVFCLKKKISEKQKIRLDT